MSQPLPPPPHRPPPAPLPQPAPASPSSAVAPQPPAAVRALPPAAKVEVTVTAANRGVAEVRVAGGETSFTLRTNLPPMPEGTRLTLQVTAQHADATALRVTEVGGRPVAQALPELQARAPGPAQGVSTPAARPGPQAPTAPPAGTSSAGSTSTTSAADSLTLSRRDGLLAIVLREPAGGRPPPQQAAPQPQQPAPQNQPAQQQQPTQQPGQPAARAAQPAPQPTQAQPQQPAPQNQPAQQPPPAQQAAARAAQPAPQPTQAQPQQPAPQNQPVQQPPPAQQPSQAAARTAQPALQPTQAQPQQPAPQNQPAQPQQPAPQNQPVQQPPPAQQPSQAAARTAQPTPQPMQAQPQQPAPQNQPVQQQPPAPPPSQGAPQPSQSAPQPTPSAQPLPSGEPAGGVRPVVVNGVTLQPGTAVFVRVAAVGPGMGHPQPPGVAASSTAATPPAAPPASGAAPAGAAPPAQTAPAPGQGAVGTPAAVTPPATPSTPAAPAGTPAAGPLQPSARPPASQPPGEPRASAAPSPALARPGEAPAPARGQAQAPTASTPSQAAPASSTAAGIAAYGGAKGPLAPQPAPWVSSNAAQPNPASLLQGTVLPGGSGEQTLVRTAAGTLAVAGRIAAPPGAQVSLEVLRAAPLPAPTPTASAAGALGAPTAFSATVWPSMTDALSLLGQMRDAGGMEAARQFSAALPRADGQMTANVAAFLGAVKAGGETRAWPGSGVMKALEAAGEKGRATAKRMGQDLSEAAVTRRDSAGTEWRVTTLPFHSGAEIQKVQLITRRQGTGDDDGSAEGEGGRKGGGQRFLVNLELSRLGVMQIDGLVRKADRRFDLIIRTHSPLPQEMRRDMTGLFANAVSAMGLKGGLSFNVTPRFESPVPDPEAPPGRPGLFA